MKEKVTAMNISLSESFVRHDRRREHRQQQRVKCFYCTSLQITLSWGHAADHGFVVRNRGSTRHVCNSWMEVAGTDSLRTVRRRVTSHHECVENEPSGSSLYVSESRCESPLLPV